MKKPLITLIFLFSMLFMMIAVPASAFELAPILLPFTLPDTTWDGTTDINWSGSGTAANPYLITSAEELAGLAHKVNGGSNYRNTYFKLTVDIRLNKDSTRLWKPIGNQERPFRGDFDGKGHIVSGLYINAENGADIGMFGSIGVGGAVRNLGLIGGFISGKNYVGTVAGYNTGLIENCWSNSRVYCFNKYAGGIAGMNAGAIVDCYNTGDIKGKENNCNNIGGITGLNNGGIITGCYNTGKISANYRVGGIVGRAGSSGVVFNCWSTGDVTSKASEVGGITGHNSPNCIIANCYNTGDVKGTHRVGGITGYNHGGVNINCYSTGEIRGNSGQTGIGAIVGYNDDKAVSGTGFMGGFDVADKAGYVVSCYWLAGTVAAGGGPRSGVGANDNNCSIIGVGKFTSPDSNIIASDRNRGGSTWLSETIEFAIGKAIEVGIEIACEKLKIDVPESLKNIKINIDSQPAFTGNSTVYTGTLLEVLNQGFGADEAGNYGKWYSYNDANSGYPVLLKKTNPVFLPPVFNLSPIDWVILAPIIDETEEDLAEESTPAPLVIDGAYPLDREIERGGSTGFSTSLSAEYPNPGSLIREWHIIAGGDDYYLSSDEEAEIDGCFFMFESDNLLRVTAGPGAESRVYQVYCDVSNYGTTVRSRTAMLTVNGIGALPPSFSDAPGLETEASPSYYFPFSDVPDSAWYRSDVEIAHKNALINGTSQSTYSPENNMTIAEAIKLAACIHQLYHEGSVTLTSGSLWYTTYVDYALVNNIISDLYSNYNAKITRREFVNIFYKALPDSEYSAKNTVGNGMIPDIPVSALYADKIYTFYRTGILTGSDAKGTFNPESNIKRSEVAAILTRMFDETTRRSISLP